jgi:hypothetical protein
MVEVPIISLPRMHRETTLNAMQVGVKFTCECTYAHSYVYNVACCSFIALMQPYFSLTTDILQGTFPNSIVVIPMKD